MILDPIYQALIIIPFIHLNKFMLRYHKFVQNKLMIKIIGHLY